MNMIVAIDGPAASGKGTLARRLAGAFGYAYLDTGSLYRAVGLAALDAGLGDAAPDSARVAELAHALDLNLLNDPRLRQELGGRMASVVAALPPVRAALLDFQRAFAKAPPAPAVGAVLDGRDIGTVVCPDARVKLFITASLETRAERRWRELTALGTAVTLDAVAADLRARDERDSTRTAAPLAKADDAHLLDTSNLGIEDVFARAKVIVETT